MTSMAPPVSPPDGDTLLVGGRVLTMSDGPAYTATAIAVRDGRIRAVGERQAVAAACPGDAQIIELNGRVVVPGLVDTHTHLCTNAVPADTIDCRDFYYDVRSVADMAERLSAGARSAADAPLLTALGSPMQDFRLAEGRFPTGADLDEAVPDRAIAISFGAHITVANSKALELIGVNAGTPDPAGGIIERDERGRATGRLYERAQLPLRNQQPRQSFEEFTSAVEQELLLAAARGVTEIHDMVMKPSEIKAYQSLAREGRLPIRVDMIVRVIESQFPKWALLDLGLQHGFGNGMLSLGGIKMSIDGGFTGRSSAWSPFEGEPCGNHPLIRIEQDELDETVRRYHEAGMRVCVHAIGDRAADMILTAYERALLADDRRDLRHRVEHMGNWLMDDTRISKAKSLGVTPVPNPAFFYFLGREVEETIGSKRTEESFPIRRLLDEGFQVSFGADAPYYWPIDPLRDAGACIARETREGMKISPDQAIDNYAALGTITRSAAWVGNVEDSLGSIEVGKLADLTVLAGDPLAVDGKGFIAMPVDLTVVGGRTVFRRG
jgi:predicted amidohydrolase YtcJ